MNIEKTKTNNLQSPSNWNRISLMSNNNL